MTGEYFIGSPVTICAATEFYAFVDGWAGKVISKEAGRYWVSCINPDGQEVKILIGGDELRDTKLCLNQ